VTDAVLANIILLDKLLPAKVNQIATRLLGHYVHVAALHAASQPSATSPLRNCRPTCRQF